MSLIGAGDIGRCGLPFAEETGLILDRYPDATIFTTGDNAYVKGTPTEFAECYDPGWGRHRARTRPSAGNHDYDTPGAAGYYAYFGDLAGNPSEGWYGYDLGSWRIMSLNSNCRDVRGCHSGSRQLEWLRTELAANAGRTCMLAYWHHPRFSTGRHGNDDRTEAFWRLLHRYGVDVVLAGHDHDYERLAPLGPTGALDFEHGIRSFVVGTGGTGLRPFDIPAAEATEIRQATDHGVLLLRLGDGGYAWEFHGVDGATFADAGSDECVDPSNRVPSVVVASPTDGAVVGPATELTLAAVASDPEDGDVTPAITWWSSRDGVIGHGSPLTTSALSLGTHVVTALAVDAHGVQASSSVTVVVAPNPGAGFDRTIERRVGSSN
nr:hypothetical protein [Actinomycetota bacterium]NIS29646.1 hypothetical protein [Actinomycetota bacterium]NIU19518.1 hypothetical protein [Actinomycetota bacterium]